MAAHTMTDIQTTRRNAQRKAFANQLYNLGAALAASTVVKLATDFALSWAVVLWIIGTILLIVLAHGLLGMIEEDS